MRQVSTCVWISREGAFKGATQYGRVTLKSVHRFQTLGSIVVPRPGAAIRRRTTRPSPRQPSLRAEKTPNPRIGRWVNEVICTP